MILGPCQVFNDIVTPVDCSESNLWYVVFFLFVALVGVGALIYYGKIKRLLPITKAMRDFEKKYNAPPEIKHVSKKVETLESLEEEKARLKAKHPGLHEEIERLIESEKIKELERVDTDRKQSDTSLP